MGPLLAPALALVAPATMDLETQATWCAAAFKALDGYSVREIERGVAAAMRTADHPAKLVPAIVREIEALGTYSRDTGRGVGRIEPTHALPAPSRQPIPHDETQAIIRAAGLKMGDTPDASRPTRVKGGSDRPGRMPTRQDYIRLFGVDPEAPDHAA